MARVIFIDTSAIIAILAFEDDAERYIKALEQADSISTGAHVRLECSMNLARILGISADSAQQIVGDFIQDSSITVLAITDATSREAVNAFVRFGKGQGHRAQLNFGDCLSYACANELGASILFKGSDFTHTDLETALP